MAPPPGPYKRHFDGQPKTHYCAICPTAHRIGDLEVPCVATADSPAIARLRNVYFEEARTQNRFWMAYLAQLHTVTSDALARALDYFQPALPIGINAPAAFSQTRDLMQAARVLATTKANSYDKIAHEERFHELDDELISKAAQQQQKLATDRLIRDLTLILSSLQHSSQQ